MTQARSKALAEYRKEQIRVRSFISRNEKKGYRFSYARPKTASQLKDVSTARIKKLTKELSEITANKLYASSKYVTHVGHTTVTVSGYKYRENRRKQAAKRGYETRKRNRKAWNDYFTNDNEQDFEENQREADKQNLERLQTDIEYSHTFTQGQIVLQKIASMINDARQQSPNSAAELQSLIDEATAKYGEVAISENLAQYEGDILESATTALKYKAGSYMQRTALSSLRSMIMGGEVPSAEEERKWQKTLDSDEYEDPLPSE